MRPYNWTKGSIPPEDRILRKVFEAYGPVNPDACWIWLGATCGKGEHKYGQIMTGSRSDGSRKVRQTHDVMYEALVGPVPEGLELDHLCRVKLCCNPRHLEPVTHLVNNQRKPAELVEKQVQAMLAARGVA